MPSPLRVRTTRGFLKAPALTHFWRNLQIERGEISDAEWEFLVRGPALQDEQNTPHNPCSSWLSDAAWLRLQVRPAGHAMPAPLCRR